MRRIVAGAHGPQPVEVPDPAPAAAGELIVAVAFAGVNGVDALRVAAGEGTELGIEFSGTVLDAGAGARFAPGDAVMGLTTGGAMSERLTIDASQCLPVPAWLGLERAAAFCENFAVAVDAVDQAAPGPDDRCLVRGATGGIGSAIVAVLRLAGHRVHGLGRADVVAAEPVWDRIFECVGPALLPDDLERAAPQARILVLGALGGTTTPLDGMTLMRNRLTVTGTTLSGRAPEEKAAILARAAERVLPAVRDGEIELAPAAVFPLDAVSDALAEYGRSGRRGKVLVAVGG